MGFGVVERKEICGLRKTHDEWKKVWYYYGNYSSSIHGKALSYVASCEQNSLGAVLEGVEKIILNDGEDYTARIKNVNARTMVIKAIKDVVSIICDVISLSLSFCRRRQLGSLND